MFIWILQGSALETKSLSFFIYLYTLYVCKTYMEYLHIFLHLIYFQHTHSVYRMQTVWKVLNVYHDWYIIIIDWYMICNANWHFFYQLKYLLHSWQVKSKILPFGFNVWLLSLSFHMFAYLFYIKEKRKQNLHTLQNSIPLHFA